MARVAHHQWLVLPLKSKDNVKEALRVAQGQVPTAHVTGLLDVIWAAGVCVGFISIMCVCVCLFSLYYVCVHVHVCVFSFYFFCVCFFYLIYIMCVCMCMCVYFHSISLVFVYVSMRCASQSPLLVFHAPPSLHPLPHTPSPSPHHRAAATHPPAS